MTSLPNYMNALRCIGQALQRRQIDVFELASDSEKFRVQCGDPNPPFEGLLELWFSTDDIKILDREGMARRGQSNREIRFGSVPEILRAVGGYVDNKRVHLRRVNNSCLSDSPSIDIEYETRDGEIRSENLSMSFVRESSVRMYKRRTQLSNPISILTNRR